MEARGTEEWADRTWHLARDVVRAPFQQRTWAELGFFLLSSALAFGSAALLAGIGFSGLILAVAFVGVVILAGGLRIARALGRWQLGLTHFMLGEAIAEPDPFVARRGFFGWIRSALSDRGAWRAVGYFVAKIPLTLFGVWFGLSCWIEAFFCILGSLTGHAGPAGFGFFSQWLRRGFSGGSLSHGVSHAGVLSIGIFFLFLAPWAMRLVVTIDRRLIQVLLGPDAASSRVRSLEVSRARTVDVAAATLRRIERDLHDGTQAQLVALAMRLGQAKDKLAHFDPAGAPQADLESIRRLIDEAHAGAKEAIVDLRDLARGIHPPALDTGLENALTTLAARCPIPTEVSVHVPTRPSPAIEAISYFCAAELLSNVAQHAAANKASLSCVQHGPWLRIVVRDDGRGGAGIGTNGSASSGLAGLADRVTTVDGHLSIASPAGGPTVITVDIPSPGGGDA